MFCVMHLFTSQINSNNNEVGRERKRNQEAMPTMLELCEDY